MTNPLIQKTEFEVKSLPPIARALWHAGHDHWNIAHEIVQDDPSPEAAWVHAFLHRVEGDLGNAQYWYHRAGKKPATDISLEKELEQLIAALVR